MYHIANESEIIKIGDTPLFYTTRILFKSSIFFFSIQVNIFVTALLVKLASDKLY